MKVAVVIPSYGREKLLLETLQSVFNQKGKFQLQVFVIDDHSPTPLSPIVHKQFPQVKVIRNRTNLKSGPSRNVALKYLKSDYVAFLDQDDLWEPDFLTQSIETIANYKAAGSLTLSKPLFDPSLPWLFKAKIWLFSLIRDFCQYTFVIFNHQIVPPSAFYLCQLSHLVFKTKVVMQYQFDPKYNFGGEDWKFVLEIMDHGKIVLVPQKLVRYRYHPASTTLIKINKINKWHSYQQLFIELKHRQIKGFMVELFRLYINLQK